MHKVVKHLVNMSIFHASGIYRQILANTCDQKFPDFYKCIPGLKSYIKVILKTYPI